MAGICASQVLARKARGESGRQGPSLWGWEDWVLLLRFTWLRRALASWGWRTRMWWNCRTCSAR